jgi:hypothetical protein
MIEDRTAMLSNCSDELLMEEVARIYHAQKESCCRLIQWSSYSLKALQLAALCLGGKALASLCYAMSMNFKQFSSGAPDLFLVRVRAKLTTFTSTSDGVEYVTIPLEYLLGYEWNQRKGRGGNSAWDDGEDLLAPPSTNTPASSSSATSDGSGKNNKRGRSWQRSAEYQPAAAAAGVVADSQKRDTNSNDNDDYNNVEEYEVLRSNKHARQQQELATVTGGEDGDVVMSNASALPPPIADSVMEQQEEGLIFPDYDTILQIKSLQHPSTSTSQEQVNGEKQDALDLLYGPALVFGEPSNTSSSSAEGNNQLSTAANSKRQDVQIEFIFESMSVEVKGPTDHLAYKQLFWLKLLSLPFYDRHKAFVCHVKET